MKNRVISVSALFFLLFLTSCKCKQLTSNAINYTAKTSVNSIVEKTYNLSKTMMLVTSFKNDLMIKKIIDYTVLDINTEKVIKCGSFEGTKLVWYTNTELKGYPHIGMIKKDNKSELLSNNNSNNNNNYSIIIEIK
ncbi:hypothetical protein [Polaribacter sp.]|uniref:hypothetical protein n=1 Tax=Polaribacter sp. TaxID=1920175 RepID=UPI0025D16984|nr:hypothetical protein [Polaribacter sp.]